MAQTIRSILRCNLLKALLLLLLVWLVGCARLPVAGPLPEGVALSRIARLDADAPFAPAPAGDKVALVRGVLRTRALATGEETVLSAAAPVALAWAPNGERLAAAFPQGEETLLQIFAAGGEVRGETAVRGRIARLLWLSETELLTAATTLEVFSFGGDHRTVLYRWDGAGEPVSVAAHSTSVKPLTLHNWGEHLYRTIHLALSPLGDEILYTRLHDPPAFSPYLKILLRHLETGGEREVARVALTSGGALFAAAETVLYGDGMGATRRVDPWTGKELASYPSPGRTLALSATGRYLLLDGRLYRDGTGIAAFPADSEGHFAAGGRLFIRHGRSLYLLAGLAEEPAAALAPAVREQLLKLRKWRSSGLISHEDYLLQKQRILDR